MNEDRLYTDFLTPDGSFAVGAGSVFYLGGKYFHYNRSASGALADARAILQDFGMVGQDIADVVEKLKHSEAKQLDLGI